MAVFGQPRFGLGEPAFEVFDLAAQPGQLLVGGAGVVDFLGVVGAECGGGGRCAFRLGLAREGGVFTRRGRRGRGHERNRAGVHA